MSASFDSRTITTDIPARLDRLPWSRFHWLIVFGLGITWILDGLEVTIVGSISGVLQEKQTLDFSSFEIGLAGSIYIAGAVTGSLIFGYLTDRFGRKRLFMITLGVYVLAAVLTAFSWSFASFALFRFITGMGIGGEYAAINSAIDELIPARVRGWVDLAINGSYWVGAGVGAAATLILLDPNIFSPEVGWRLAFLMGAILGIVIIFVRRHLPESPRWLMTHGRPEEAERIVREIEQNVRDSEGVSDLPEVSGSITIKPRKSIGFVTIAKILFKKYPRRSVLGFSLMVSQAFFYNAIFFTYALVLTKFYDVSVESVGLYLIPFAVGNFLGPLLLGRFFDSVGRRKMIAGTYLISGVLLAITGYLFVQGVLTATTQTICWSVIFFFASAGASSAYLTVSEIFPLETRAMAIAFFYSLGTGAGGLIGPALFGALIQTSERINVYYGYLIGAGLMIAAAIVEFILGVNAEKKPLEEIAEPITEVKEDGTGAASPMPAA